MIPTFLNHANSIHHNIQITLEMEENGQLVLDVLIQREINDSLSSSVYRKPTTNDRYLDFKSNNPIGHKINTAKTL